MAWTNVDLEFRITCQTATTLELKNFSYVMQGLGLFLVGVSIGGVWNAGFTQLNCQRLGNAVNCTALEFRLLGLIPHRSVSLSPLEGIFTEQQAVTDDEGNSYMLHRLILDGGNDVSYVLLQPSRNQARVQAIATQLTQFTQTSTSQTLTLTDRSWFPILAPLAFLPVGLMLMLNPFALCLIDRNRGTITVRHYSPLLGNTTFDSTYPVREVVGVAVEEWKGEEDTGYRVVLILQGQICQPLIKTFSPGKGRKLNGAEQIRNFLNLPPVISLASKSTHSGLEVNELFLTGAMGTFWTIAPERLSQAQHQQLDAIAQQLAALNFEPLGSLIYSRFSNVIVHGFAQTAGTAYAVVMHGVERDSIAVDFYTSFSSGASLTTSTTRGIGSLPRRKLYRQVYLGQNPRELWTRHRHSVAEMSAKEGIPKRCEPELRSLAMAIDEFFTRYPKDPLFTLSVYATQLWYAFVSPNAAR